MHPSFGIVRMFLFSFCIIIETSLILSETPPSDSGTAQANYYCPAAEPYHILPYDDEAEIVEEVVATDVEKTHDEVRTQLQTALPAPAPESMESEPEATVQDTGMPEETAPEAAIERVTLQEPQEDRTSYEDVAPAATTEEAMECSEEVAHPPFSFPSSTNLRMALPETETQVPVPVRTEEIPCEEHFAEMDIGAEENVHAEESEMQNQFPADTVVREEEVHGEVLIGSVEAVVPDASEECTIEAQTTTALSTAASAFHYVHAIEGEHLEEGDVPQVAMEQEIVEVQMVHLECEEIPHFIHDETTQMVNGLDEEEEDEGARDDQDEETSDRAEMEEDQCSLSQYDEHSLSQEEEHSESQEEERSSRQEEEHSLSQEEEEEDQRSLRQEEELALSQGDEDADSEAERLKEEEDWRQEILGTGVAYKLNGKNHVRKFVAQEELSEDQLLHSIQEIVGGVYKPEKVQATPPPATPPQSPPSPAPLPPVRKAVVVNNNLVVSKNLNERSPTPPPVASMRIQIQRKRLQRLPSTEKKNGTLKPLDVSGIVREKERRRLKMKMEKQNLMKSTLKGALIDCVSSSSSSSAPASPFTFGRHSPKKNSSRSGIDDDDDDLDLFGFQGQFPIHPQSTLYDAESSNSSASSVESPLNAHMEKVTEEDRAEFRDKLNDTRNTFREEEERASKRAEKKVEKRAEKDEEMCEEKEEHWAERDEERRAEVTVATAAKPATPPKKPELVVSIPTYRLEDLKFNLKSKQLEQQGKERAMETEEEERSPSRTERLEAATTTKQAAAPVKIPEHGRKQERKAENSLLLASSIKRKVESESGRSESERATKGHGNYEHHFKKLKLTLSPHRKVWRCTEAPSPEPPPERTAARPRKSVSIREEMNRRYEFPSQPEAVDGPVCEKEARVCLERLSQQEIDGYGECQRPPCGRGVLITTADFDRWTAPKRSHGRHAADDQRQPQHHHRQRRSGGGGGKRAKRPPEPPTEFSDAPAPAHKPRSRPKTPTPKPRASDPEPVPPSSAPIPPQASMPKSILKHRGGLKPEKRSVIGFIKHYSVDSAANQGLIEEQVDVPPAFYNLGFYVENNDVVTSCSVTNIGNAANPGGHVRNSKHFIAVNDALDKNLTVARESFSEFCNSPDSEDIDLPDIDQVMRCLREDDDAPPPAPKPAVQTSWHIPTRISSATSPPPLNLETSPSTLSPDGGGPSPASAGSRVEAATVAAAAGGGGVKDTRLPLKKRRRPSNVADKKQLGDFPESDISYPATPMISIAEFMAEFKREKTSSALATAISPSAPTAAATSQPSSYLPVHRPAFKTPAELKQMPVPTPSPPPVPHLGPSMVYNLNGSDPGPIITDQFNINNHTYNNPTINYHMSNVPFINLPYNTYYHPMQQIIVQPFGFPSPGAATAGPAHAPAGAVSPSGKHAVAGKLPGVEPPRGSRRQQQRPPSAHQHVVVSTPSQIYLRQNVNNNTKCSSKQYF